MVEKNPVHSLSHIGSLGGIILVGIAYRYHIFNPTNRLNIRDMITCIPSPRPAEGPPAEVKAGARN